MVARISCCLWTFPISDRDPDCMEKFAYTDTETLLWDYSETEEHYILVIPPARRIKTLYRVTQVYAYQWFGINGGNNLKIIYYPFAQTHFRNLTNPCDCPPESVGIFASISVSPTSVLEDSGTPMIYTVTLDIASLYDTTVNFTLTGTATEGVDYTAVTHSVTITAGQTTGTFAIHPIADALTEADETVIATLIDGTSGVNVVVISATNGQATGTIIDARPSSCPDPGVGFATIVNAVNACLLNADNNCITAAIAIFLPWPVALTYDPTTAVSTTLSNGDLTASNQLAYWRGARSTTTQSSGKWYFEITFVKSNNAISNQAGMAITPTSVTNFEDAVEVNGAVLFANSGGISIDGLSLASLKSFSNTAVGDVYGVAVDLTNNKAWFRIVGGPNINLNWNNNGAANPATNVGGASLAGGSTYIWAACNYYADNDTTEAWTANFGGSAFTGAAPVGFSAWGNTATWDPSTNVNMALSGGNLIATNTTSDPRNQGVEVATALAQSVGRYYFECTLDLVTLSNGHGGGPGIALTTATYPDLFNFATNGASVDDSGGTIFSNGIQSAFFLDPPVSGDTIGIAVDLYNRKIWFKIVAGPSSSGAFWNGDLHANPAINKNGVGIVSGNMVPVAYFGEDRYPGSSVITVNFNPAIIPIS